MKSVVANFSFGRRSMGTASVLKVFSRGAASARGISLEFMEIPEPPIPGPSGSRVRSISQAFPSLDETMFVHH